MHTHTQPGKQCYIETELKNIQPRGIFRHEKFWMQCISKGEEEGRKNQCDSIIRIDAKINRKNVQTWTDKFNGKFLAQIVTFWNE